MVMTGFYIASAALVVVALLLILAPLLRQPARKGNARYSLPIVLVLGLPIATAGLYRLVGTPDAIARRVYATAQPQVQPADAPAVAATGEQARAAEANADAAQALESWMQQARTHEQDNRPADAREAYAQALKIAPDLSAAIVGWVAADMATRSDFAIDADSRSRLQQVVAREPDHQRGLWLLGISDFQQQDYRAASEHWRHLHGLLDAGSPMQKAVADKIAVAESLASARQSGRAAP
ncbi:tetratricopeptide repeat protein [Xanthomonas arboricola]|uniref:tetratricopeptide repeat protein n=1 Tax=Xanthomonas arboricola TaxID=56448 RepID=UPI0014310AC4|nr:tetratricopeptide repeat protein [Xanthomonas arboricola]